MPRITVLVPAHDAEPFLGQALDSLLAQTVPDWEAVVVDDASSDATYAVADAYARREPRIRAFRLERNSGPAEARRRAAALARGELLGLLDADDRWLPTYLERQLALFDDAAAAGRRVGIVACNALVERANGVDAATFHEQFGYAEPITYDRMLERCYVFVGAVVARRAYEEVGGFAPECWGTEDYDLWLRIIEAGYEVVQTTEPLAVYRYHGAGISRNDLGMSEANMIVFRRALERGATTAAQRRRIRAALRHNRALHERALLRRAWRERRPAGVAGHALRAAPLGLVAFAQAPSRWGEWLMDVRRGRAGPSS